jgi:hypothetical protein
MLGRMHCEMRVSARSLHGDPRWDMFLGKMGLGD